MNVRCIALPGLPFGLEAKVSFSKDVLSSLPKLELTLTNDYYSAFRRRSTASVKVLAGTYLTDHSSGRWREDALLCPEMPVPSHLASIISIRVVSPNLLWSQCGVALLHAGRRGCMAPVHFDWDHSWVAHVCLSGRKRFFFFPPEAGWLLSPIVNTSALCIPRLSFNDRRELLRRLDGVEIVLSAGEGILFPSLYWHGVLYETPSLSMSFRFEAAAGGRPLAALPRSWLLQRLVWRFFQEEYGAESREFLGRYLRCFFTRKYGWKERYRRVAELCSEELLRYGDEQGVTGVVAENFSGELALASRELRFWYGSEDWTRLADATEVQEAAGYLFADIGVPLDAGALRLAAYAVAVRQGLPPKRGLVEIKTEKSI